MTKEKKQNQCKTMSVEQLFATKERVSGVHKNKIVVELDLRGV